MCWAMVARAASFVMCSLNEMPSTLLRHLISTARIFLCSSTVSVHVLHAYKTIDRTNACSSFTLVDRLVFLSHHIGFSFSGAAAVCAALARTSVFESSTLRIAPREKEHHRLGSAPTSLLANFVITGKPQQSSPGQKHKHTHVKSALLLSCYLHLSLDWDGCDSQGVMESSCLLVA